MSELRLCLCCSPYDSETERERVTVSVSVCVFEDCQREREGCVPVEWELGRAMLVEFGRCLGEEDTCHAGEIS